MRWNRGSDHGDGEAMTPLDACLFAALFLAVAGLTATAIVLAVRATTTRPVSFHIAPDPRVPGAVQVTERVARLPRGERGPDPGEEARKTAVLHAEQLARGQRVGTFRRSANPLEADEPVEEVSYE